MDVILDKVQQKEKILYGYDFFLENKTNKESLNLQLIMEKKYFNRLQWNIVEEDQLKQFIKVIFFFLQWQKKKKINKTKQKNF
mgnify:CR=1 FL=1